MRYCSPVGVHASVGRRVAGEPTPVVAAPDVTASLASASDVSVFSRWLEDGEGGAEEVSLVGVVSPPVDDGTT